MNNEKPLPLHHTIINVARMLGLVQNCTCACDVDRGLLRACASQLSRWDREIIRMKSVHSRFREQKAHKIRKRSLPVEIACCHGPAIKALNCCAKSECSPRQPNMHA